MKALYVPLLVLAFSIQSGAAPSTGKVECAARAAARKLASRSWDNLLNTKSTTSSPRKVQIHTSKRGTK